RSAHIERQDRFTTTVTGRVHQPQVGAAVVTEDVAAIERTDRRPAPPDDTADHRAAEVMAVLGDRHREAGLVATLGRLEAMEALHHVPAEVEALRPGAGDVDLLPGVLADVAD